MQCTTVRNGVECTLMTKGGCGFVGGNCVPVVEACQGCSRTREFPTGTYCIVAPKPASRWTLGPCNMATHIERKTEETVQKLNPLKASKRAAAGGGKKR
jgi:hypothetical protein